jgi:acetoin utilization protein AcuB
MQLPDGSKGPKTPKKPLAASPVASKVSKSMTRHVLCALPDDHIADAYQLMKDIHCRHLPVVSEGKLIGILSDRDILLRATYGDHGISFPEVRISQIMSTKVISCRPSARLSAVAEIMLSNGVDSIPVTDDANHLLGMITSADLLKVMHRDQTSDGGGDTVLDILSTPRSEG